MHMTISGHHLEVTDPIREYVTTKLAKLERHYDHINSTAVILSVEKLSQKAEATIHVSGGELFANAEHEDLYAAIDALSDKLDRQLIKYKEKYEILVVPNITNICYGRGVGYKIEEIILPKEIQEISATKIRKEMNEV